MPAVIPTQVPMTNNASSAPVMGSRVVNDDDDDVPSMAAFMDLLLLHSGDEENVQKSRLRLKQ